MPPLKGKKRVAKVVLQTQTWFPGGMKNSEPMLSFPSLVECARQRFAQVADPRKRVSDDLFPLVDVITSGLAMFHFQDPSLLQFQKALEDSQRMSNLTTMFHVSKVPKSTQMRTLLDEVLPEEILPVFDDVFHRADAGKVLHKFRFLGGRYLFLMDASEYFSSKKRSCPGCLQARQQDGTIRYHHNILQVALAKPGFRQVLPITAEEIRQEDGKDKQDCEINAATRLIPRLVRSHPHMDIVIVADGLYSHVPFVQLLRSHDLSFILVAKPSDHVALFEDLKGLREAGAVGRLERIDKKGRRHIYEFCPEVSLRSDAKVRANWFSYRLINASGEVGYENSWITDLRITAQNVEELVEAGRSRWKIENENFNTLKNQGYHIEHNFGHGKNHLSFVLFLLNLLAFTIHQILEIRDVLLQKLYAKIGSRKEMWMQIRTLVNLFVFKSWKSLLSFMLDRRLRQSLQLSG